jgi:hypothetical protein
MGGRPYRSPCAGMHDVRHGCGLDSMIVGVPMNGDRYGRAPNRPPIAAMLVGMAATVLTVCTFPGLGGQPRPARFFNLKRTLPFAKFLQTC